MLLITYLLLGLVLILTYACRRLWLANQTKDVGIREYAFRLENDLQETGRILRQQDEVLSGVGQLFVRAGAGFERAGFKQESEDLKRLGSILRSREDQPESRFEIMWAQPVMVELGDRYGIEPVSGESYSIHKLIRIGDEIIQSTLSQEVLRLETNTLIREL